MECVTVTRTWALQAHQASSTSKITCELPKHGVGNNWYVMTMYVDSLKVSVVTVVKFHGVASAFSKVSAPR